MLDCSLSKVYQFESSLNDAFQSGDPWVATGSFGAGVGVLPSVGAMVGVLVWISVGVVVCVTLGVTLGVVVGVSNETPGIDVGATSSVALVDTGTAVRVADTIVATVSRLAGAAVKVTCPQLVNRRDVIRIKGKNLSIMVFRYKFLILANPVESKTVLKIAAIFMLCGAQQT